VDFSPWHGDPIGYQFRVLTLGSLRRNQWGDFVWTNLEVGDFEGVYLHGKWSWPNTIFNNCEVH
jgi:hypothetical protein